ncbi:MAG: phosphoribosylglycinamide synthetase C domain-containing protein [Candidatus Aenigmatarchaeota archaeon]
MNILVLNPNGRYNFIAKKFADDNNTVFSYPKSDKNKDLSKVFANIEEKFGFKYIDKLPSADSIDLVFNCALTYAKMSDIYQKSGVPVFGGNQQLAEFELDRNLGKKLMISANIPVAPYFSGKIKDAMEWVKSKKIKAVIKPHNNLETFKTYIPYTFDDTIVALERLLKTNPEIPVTVEQYIDGVEVGIETFFNGFDFLRPINISFEHKKLEENDLGALCGETGTIMFYDFLNEEMFDMTLARIKPLLQSLNYHGDLAIGCMYDPDNDKLYGLEWTFRIGMPEFLIQLSLLSDFTDTIYRIATDPNFLYLDIEDKFLTGVWYHLSGYPFVSGKALESISGFPINGYQENMKNVYLVDVAYSKEKKFYYTVTGEILVATGVGETLKESINDAYDLLSQIKVVNGKYRTDIGYRVMNKDIPVLYKAGLISQEKYLRSVVL